MAVSMCGFALMGFGVGSICRASSNSQIIMEKKRELYQSSTPFVNMLNIPEQKRVLVSVCSDETQTSGILNILQKRVEKISKIVINSDKFTFEEWDYIENVYWENHSTHGIGLNLGLTNFVPPKDFNNILFTYKDKSEMSAITSEGLEEQIKKYYSVNLGSLPKGVFKAEFNSCGSGKPVFAVGKRCGDNFTSEIMGTNEKDVINKVFKNEEAYNDTEYLLGTIGVCVGAMIFGTSFIK